MNLQYETEVHRTVEDLAYAIQRRVVNGWRINGVAETRPDYPAQRKFRIQFRATVADLKEAR